MPLTVGGLIVIAVIIAIVLVGVGAFLNLIINNIFYVAGGLVLVAGLIIAIKKPEILTNKTFWIGALIIGGIVFAGAFFVQQSVFSSQYIEAPVFAWLSCEPSGISKESVDFVLPTEGKWISCPENSAECDINVETPLIGASIYAYRFCYQFCRDGINQNCNAIVCSNIKNIGQAGQMKLFEVGSSMSGNNVVFAQMQRSITGFSGWSGVAGSTYYYKYIPFTIWTTNILSGGKFKYSETQEGCIVPSDIKNKGIIFTNIERIVNSNPSGNLKETNIKSTLLPYETFNYIAGFVTRPSPSSVETYNGETAYCIRLSGSSSAQMMKLNRVETQYATYYVVDTNWNENLGFVQCCENEAKPGYICRDHSWVKIEQAQCDMFRPCSGSAWTRDASSTQQIIRYNCVDGKCVAETKPVECTLDSDCGNGEICSGDWQCISGYTGTTPEEVEVPTADSIEKNCKALLFGLIPAQFVNVEQEKCTSFWCEIGLAKKTKTTTPKCIYDYTFLVIALLFILAIVIIILALNKKKRKNVKNTRRNKR